MIKEFREIRVKDKHGNIYKMHGRLGSGMHDTTTGKEIFEGDTVEIVTEYYTFKSKVLNEYGSLMVYEDRWEEPLSNYAHIENEKHKIRIVEVEE